MTLVPDPQAVSSQNVLVALYSFRVCPRLVTQVSVLGASEQPSAGACVCGLTGPRMSAGLKAAA